MTPATVLEDQVPYHRLDEPGGGAPGQPHYHDPRYALPYQHMPGTVTSLRLSYPKSRTQEPTHYHGEPGYGPFAPTLDGQSPTAGGNLHPYAPHWQQASPCMHQEAGMPALMSQLSSGPPGAPHFDGHVPSAYCPQVAGPWTQGAGPDSHWHSLQPQSLNTRHAGGHSLGPPSSSPPLAFAHAQMAAHQLFFPGPQVHWGAIARSPTAMMPTQASASQPPHQATGCLHNLPHGYDIYPVTQPRQSGMRLPQHAQPHSHNYESLGGFWDSGHARRRRTVTSYEPRSA